MFRKTNSSRPPVALTIAGFDPSSGAGVTADLQVFASMGLFGTACLTALTVQSTRGVTRTQAVDPALLRDMLRCLVSDLPPDGIKIGMLGNLAITRVVAEFLVELSVDRAIPIVLDPVLRSSSGALLLEEDAWEAFLRELAPLATCVTPNQAELASLTARALRAPSDVSDAAESLVLHAGVQNVLVTGGDLPTPTDLLVQAGSAPLWIEGKRIETTSTHGTGCAFSSALLSRLVLGDDLEVAARAAKSFVEQGLGSAPGVGSGKGPMKLSGTPYASKKREPQRRSSEALR